MSNWTMATLIAVSLNIIATILSKFGVDLNLLLLAIMLPFIIKIYIETDKN